MESGGGGGRIRMSPPPTEWVMCSTCSGFVLRERRTSEVVEVVKKAEKMRDLMKAVLLHGPLQEIEPAEATKEQWQDLQTRRRIMVETKRCPTCFGSLLEACPTCCRSLLQKLGPDEKDKAMVADPGSKAGLKEKKKRSREEGSELMAVLPSQGGAGLKEKKKRSREEGSELMAVLPSQGGAGLKEKKKRSREEGSELMAVLPSQGGKERKKIAMEGEAMVADARSEQNSKQSREEGKRSSSGLKEKMKAKSENDEDSGSKKKAKRWSEVEGSRSKEAKVEGSGSKVEEKIEDIVQLIGGNKETKMETRRLLKATFEILSEPLVKPQPKEAKMEDSKFAVGNRKTKMVTERMDKKAIDILKNQPRPEHIIDNTMQYRPMLDMIAAIDEVERVFLEYLQCHSFIKGYAEYQMEVTTDDDEHKLV